MLATHVESVEEVVAVLFVLHKQLEVLENALVHRHGVVVADRVLAEEVKLHDKLLAVHLLVQLDVLHAQAAAADGVRRVLVLLVACSQRQLWGTRCKARLDLRLKL